MTPQDVRPDDPRLAGTRVTMTGPPCGRRGRPARKG